MQPIILKNRTKKHKLSYKSQLKKAKQPKMTEQVIQAKWINFLGVECRVLNQLNKCFCGHILKKHSLDQNQKAKCAQPGCQCNHYQFIPSFDIKCICKHSFQHHNNKSRKCDQCLNCLGFVTSWSCTCGYKYLQHTTAVQSVFKGKIQRRRVAFPKINSNFGQQDEECYDSLEEKLRRKRMKNILKESNQRMLKKYNNILKISDIRADYKNNMSYVHQESVSLSRFNDFLYQRNQSNLF